MLFDYLIERCVNVGVRSLRMHEIINALITMYILCYVQIVMLLLTFLVCYNLNVVQCLSVGLV